jgi:AmmeMemoRadiSam system protein B
MSITERENPCLRPVEAIPDEENGRVILRDPTQLASGLLVVGEAELLLLSLLDGTRSRLEVRGEFTKRTGQIVLSADLDGMLEQLEEAGYLEGPAFESYYDGLAAEYRALPFRPLRDPDSYGAPAPQLREYLDEILSVAEATTDARDGAPAGIVAPHLDFERGFPCYAEGYRALLAGGERPRRVVILGTNHFGRSQSVVATTKDFQTPWGVLPTDRAFLARLQTVCGGNLAPYELDHLHEHSIELQAVWLHHLFGEDASIVPVLCPDPSRSRGTAPGDPDGVDLKQFSLALGRLVREDPEPTLLIASADLSHVGGYFGDETELSAPFLAEVRQADDAALELVDRNAAEPFRKHMAATRNPTRVCSVGCLYALMTALGPEARARRLRYHQAVTAELQNCVTSAAYAFYAAP